MRRREIHTGLTGDQLKKLRSILPGGLALLALGSTLIHPFGPAKVRPPAKLSSAEPAFDPQAAAIVEKACRNCHSESTEWPWYSYVAPMSWMIEHDVQRARAHMNLSHWTEYSLESQQRFLSEMSVLARNRVMPLPRYLLLHPEARLSDAEIANLSQWARSERKRLRAVAASKTSRISAGSK
jgi:heme-binding protein